MAFHPLAWIAILYGWIQSIIQRIVLYALRAGPIPNHVAFIMDGNRRFARKKNEPVAKGHEGGSDALRNVIVSVWWLNVSLLNLDE
jgi:ditrans,polycis-polyprenyl diphosphate synthase